MRFEYILLFLLSILPIIYKLWYWEDVFRKNNFSLQWTLRFLKTKEGREYLFHFWTLLELPLFLISFLVLISSPFEILLFNAFFYLLILYNIFVVWKILRKSLIFPSKSLIIFSVLSLILIDTVFSILINPLLVYVSLSWIFIFIPLYFMICIYIFQRLRVYK